MPVHNTDVAAIFSKVADMLEIEGANQFRVRAYRNAARTVGDLPQSVAEKVARGEDLSKLPGIGKDLAGKIQEIVETGTLAQLKELEEKTPPELNKLMRMSGLGPKKVQALHQHLGITNLEELKKAANNGKIRELPGFGKKTEEMIKESIQEAESQIRIKLMQAEQIAGPLIGYLKKAKGVMDIDVAGSYRRRRETVGDLDILVSCKKECEVMERFVEYEDVTTVISRGETRSSVELRSGLQVDLRVVPQASYGAALHYFTGSKAHNIAIRKLGVRRNLKINEYGVFKEEKRVAGKSEEEVYAQVDLPFIEPELRENLGEVEAAQKGELPLLITQEDICGDLHAHTKETDGRNTLEEMVRAARERNYEYLAISEHSKRVTMARGLDAERLARQIKEIDRLNEKLEDFVVLKAIEVDILEDGSLDLPDGILKELDLTICSVHYNLNLPRERQTERIIRAMDNRYFHILGHPTGRLINERPGYQVDLERVMEVARDRGCILELNAHPDRLDLPDRYCKMAKDMGIKLAISTDAHSTTDLDFMRFGVGAARRGWLEPEDVVNTRPWEELQRLLRRR